MGAVADNLLGFEGCKRRSVNAHERRCGHSDRQKGKSFFVCVLFSGDLGIGQSPFHVGERAKRIAAISVAIPGATAKRTEFIAQFRRIGIRKQYGANRRI